MPLSDFHPAVREWFEDVLGRPSPPQEQGWPVIRAGHHTLIAAPTGTGKTLTAFLVALDGLLRAESLSDETTVLYISPLRALGNDVQKNLLGPIAELRERHPELPDIRVLVRSGDTTSSERARMVRQPPHILVTTPESLYVLLTSDSGRGMLKTIRTVIVDEIHAMVGDKRGSHLALSLERLEALAGPFQRIGLSATQKPLEEVGRFLAGVGREITLVDVGHLRQLDLAVEVPPSPLQAVCPHEVWDECYRRIVELIHEHRTTLIFVGTRKLSERIAARLSTILGEDQVTCHHSSLAKDRRLDAEQRLKSGQLRALVATASLELGIDIGDVDLVIQIGAVRRIATYLQRVGRSGHAMSKTPKGRHFALTRDELVEAAALMRAVRIGELDRLTLPKAPRDVLGQQIVAACVAETWDEDALFDCLRRAWPYRELTREAFDEVIGLYTEGRLSILHRDGVGGKLRGTKRARLPAIQSGGVIPDTGDYRVLVEPEGTFVGTVNEDFAIESSVGDVFQLGNASWQILKVSSGEMRVADAKGAPPTLPFWFGEAPARSEELSREIGRVREEAKDRAWLERECGLAEDASEELWAFLEEGISKLGVAPSQRQVVAERFFDESGGMQLVLHAPFGGRINRAWGLALRKRFCRGFGFELQAAANEEAILLSLGPQHSFPLEEIFTYLHSSSAEKVLRQALLASPMFETRWRWNVTRALLVPRRQRARRVPTPLQRFRADDLLAAAFPDVVACAENLPGGDIDIPDHPLVQQTIEDCLTEAMDLEGFLGVLRGIETGIIRTAAVDLPEPSPFAASILNAAPYAFLDDAPLEERRTQAVLKRRSLDNKTVDEIGALDPEAVRRVREEAWPDPESAEELHECLLWMGYLTELEAKPWAEWIRELSAAGRVSLEHGHWYAREATREPLAVLRGRMEALGPVFVDDPEMVRLEQEGSVLRIRLEGRDGWCNRRLLARIQRYTLEALRREIEPVDAMTFWRFLASWQGVDPEHRFEGPEGVAKVFEQLAGFEAPVATWEQKLLPARVRDFQRRWVDELTLSGRFAWGRLWGSGKTAIRSTPISFVPRDELGEWLALAGPSEVEKPGASARAILEVLKTRGALFPAEVAKAARLLPSQADDGVAELIASGLLTCDAFGGLRQLITPPSKRKRSVVPLGRFCAFRSEGGERPSAEWIAMKLLKRTGVVFRKLLEREKVSATWRELSRALRILELRGDVRGGRFVARFSGEQFALPEAIPLLRKTRKRSDWPDLEVAAADPLNLGGILTPDERVAPTLRRSVLIAAGAPAES
ncbi:MAG: DEAD/DEAH box helicase [Planctomycetota bacterium]